MYLIQILLPRYDPAGAVFPTDMYRAVIKELTDRFGGATSYTRALAEGIWHGDDGRTHHDDVLIVEVMAPSVEAPWWRNYRQRLQRSFRQRELVVRAHAIQLL